MDKYVTGAVIKRLRESKSMTQSALAERLCVSDKTISKWETGRGYPDVTLIEPIAAALGISVIELLSGADVTNGNRSFNMARAKFYVCPVCGNVITAAGDAVVSCCGITLPAAEPEDADGEHAITLQNVEDEYYVTLDHPMERGHYISFIAAVSDNAVKLVKLYPEGPAEAYFKRGRVQYVYAYCNRHGLVKIKV